jgi:hypothetical protein
MTSVSTLWTLPGDDVVSVTYRRIELNRDGGSHPLTHVPLDFDNVELRYSRALGIGRVSLGAGFDSDRPEGGSEVRGYLSWQQGF